MKTEKEQINQIKKDLKRIFAPLTAAQKIECNSNEIDQTLTKYRSELINILFGG